MSGNRSRPRSVFIYTVKQKKYSPEIKQELKRIAEDSEIVGSVEEDIGSEYYLASDFQGLQFALAEAYRKRAVVLTPQLRPLLAFAKTACPILRSGVRVIGVDRPGLSKRQLISEIDDHHKCPQGRTFRRFWDGQFRQKSAQIKKGLEAARSRGVQLGNPKIEEARAKALQSRQPTSRDIELMEVMVDMRNEGLSLRRIADVMNDVLELTSPRWHASSVRNALLWMERQKKAK